MDLVLHSNKIEEYLKHDDVIDFENEAIAKLADELFQKAQSELDFIKAGVDAQFSLETERLAFAVRPELGEEDGFVIYLSPDVKVVERLRKAKTRTELWENLPTELEQLK